MCVGKGDAALLMTVLFAAQYAEAVLFRGYLQEGR